MQPLSLYVHIPWCIKKCPYCDFNSHAKDGILPEVAYVDALIEDLQHDVNRFHVDRSILSIFIGGGTPSLFAPESFDRLLAGIRRLLRFDDAIEITLEANPGTFESGKFSEFRQLGINRLSIGVQSFDDGLLRRLGRIHNGQEAISAAEIAHRVGFDNFNLDLMFGLPGTGSDESYSDVKIAVDLKPSHISFYQLTLEPNTYFHKYPPQLPDDESIFLCQQRCRAFLERAGYAQYEISAYAKTDRACRHNLNYWRFGDYLGIGAGAHGKMTLGACDGIVRYAKVKNPERYLENPCHDTTTDIDLAELPLEYVMNRLRLRRGFSFDHYRRAVGLSPDTLEPALSECLTSGLLELSGGRYRCSERGWFFLDSILEKFIR